MPSASLRSKLASLADTFASSVLAAIRGASLDDLLSEAQGTSRSGRRERPRTADGAPLPRRPSRKGRLGRRSPEDIAKTLAQVVALVKRHPKGLRSEQIRHALKLDKREVPRVLHEGLSKKMLRARGHKRATTYSASGAGAAKAAKNATKRKRTRKAPKKT